LREKLKKSKKQNNKTIKEPKKEFQTKLVKTFLEKQEKN